MGDAMNAEQRRQFDWLCETLKISGDAKITLSGFISGIALEEWCRGQREMANHVWSQQPARNPCV